jgi:hypothetical protein
MVAAQEYVDDIVISAAVLADSGLYFVGRNSSVQRDVFQPGPWPNIAPDATRWLDLSVWITQQGMWNDIEDVPILILRPDRTKAAWLWARVAYGDTALMRAVSARDVECDYGLAVYLRGEDLRQGLPAGSQVLHIRGRHER